MKNKIINYWFTIEPYVYIRITKNKILLYNTLDGTYIESTELKIIKLLQELLNKKNHGVILLSSDQIQDTKINFFIKEIRKKFMGDIIDTTLTKAKPIQLLPLFNYINTDNLEIYKKHNFSINRNILKLLSEINIYIDKCEDINPIILFLKTLPDRLLINIVGICNNIIDYHKLLSVLNSSPFPKNITCSYKDITRSLQNIYTNKFKYIITIDFPVNYQLWNKAIQYLKKSALEFELIFNIHSTEDYQQAEQIVKKFHIYNYQFKPIYNGYNIKFFKENIFLSKEDILSTHISLKNIFTNQSINIYDFGKFNIMSNGDVFSNLNYPPIGNIYKNNLQELVWEEIKKGNSWLRIRNQAPCNDCVFQWLCPSPSDYEIAIGYSNLCHINN